MQYRIKAQNIKCEGCAVKIKEALLQTAGVEAVTVDVKNGVVEVHTSKMLSEHQLRSRLSEIGYPDKPSLLKILKGLFP